MQVSFQMKPAEQAEVLKNLNVGSSRYPSFLDGFSKATDNIRLQRHGKRGMDGEKTNVDVLGKCKSKDGKIADHRRSLKYPTFSPAPAPVFAPAPARRSRHDRSNRG